MSAGALESAVLPSSLPLLAVDHSIVAGVVFLQVGPALVSLNASQARHYAEKLAHGGRALRRHAGKLDAERAAAAAAAAAVDDLASGVQS